MLLTSVSSDISQASMKALSEARGASTSNRPVLRKSASMAFQQAPDEIRFFFFLLISTNRTNFSTSYFSSCFTDGCKYGGSPCVRRMASTQRLWPCLGCAMASSCAAWITRSPSTRNGGKTLRLHQPHALPQVGLMVEGV